MESKSLPMEMHIKDNINKGDFTGEENIIGPMALHMMAILFQAIEKEVVDGDQLKKVGIFTLDNIVKIRKKVEGSIYGQMDVDMMDCLETTSSKFLS